jgi:hypothetical protein
MINDCGQPTKHEPDAIGIVDGRTPYQSIERVQIIVVLPSEIASQYSTHLIEGEWTGRHIHRNVCLPRDVASGKITMGVIVGLTDFLESIEQHMDMAHIVGMLDRGSQDHLRDELGQGQCE